MSVEILPPSRRPGAHSRWRVLVREAIEDGRVRDGVANSPEEARLVGRQIRRAALAEGAQARMSYGEPYPTGQTRWYVQVSQSEEKTK